MWLAVSHVMSTSSPIREASKEVRVTAALTIAVGMAKDRSKRPTRRNRDQAVAVRRCRAVRAFSLKEEDEKVIVFPWRDRVVARPSRVSGGQGVSGARCPSPLVSSDPLCVKPRKRWRKTSSLLCKSTKSPACRSATTAGSTVT